MAGTNPRAARIAALIQRVVASSIERELHDKRLASITVTEVRVTNDLQIAKVYWTQLGHEGHEEGERKRAQQARATAQYAGDADPYKHDDEPSDDFEDDSDEE